MKSKFLWFLSMALLSVIGFSGCSEGATKGASLLPHDNQIHPELDNAYISELFYRNDLGTCAPDPCVIKITDESSSEFGYYYLYGTTNPDTGYRAYRNKDLTGPWEEVTGLKGFRAFEAEEGHFAYKKGCFWAPEVIYDKETDKYYLFYSASVSGKEVSGGQRMIAVAVADEPYGPFTPATTDGLDASKTLFPNDEIVQVMMDKGYPSYGKKFGCIDAHPYVDPDGNKYLYLSAEHNKIYDNSDIYVVKMESWTKPVLNSLTRLTKCGGYTVDDSYTDKSGSTVPNYEENNTINEGPYVYHRKQADGSYLYYLTLSVNGYSDKSYSVIQAIGNSPMGPFRKLTEEEGGIVLSTDWQTFDHVSGTGHHSFVKVEDDLYIVYHEHVARETGGLGERDVAVDKVKFIKNGNGQEIIYANGPTWSLQPRIPSHSGYKNLALDAEIFTDGGTNVEALNDDLLTIYSGKAFVKEFESDKTVTITIKFDDYREVSAIMIYNSRIFEHSFVDIKNIDFNYKKADGSNGTAVIEHLPFNWNFYKMSYTQAMRPGGSAVAVFNPLMVNEIKVTVELPETRPDDIIIMDDEGYIQKQTKVAVSEIVVLGK